MNQLLEFIVNHWILWILLLIILLLIILEQFRAKLGSSKGVTAQQLVTLINREHAVIADVRNKDDFVEGHIIDAINTPKNEIEKNPKRLEKYKQRVIVICCQVGKDSMMIANALAKQGFVKVYYLMGGINSWRSAGLPIVKSE